MINPIRLFFGKQVTPTSVALFHNPKEARWMETNYTTYSSEGFKKNAIAFRCIDLVSSSCASIPWILFSGYGKARKEISEHPILDLLRKPNPRMSRKDLSRIRISHLLINGNSYIAGVGPRPGAPPMELWTIRPDRMTVKPGANGLPEAYVLKVNERETVYPVDKLGRSPIDHWRTFNPTSDWYGMPRLEAAAKNVDILNAGDSWNLALRQNSCKPSGAFVFEGEVDENQRSQMRKDLAEQYEGARNAGKIMILGNGLTWQGMSLTPKEMDFLESDKVSERHVALVFGVPGQLIGLEGSQTYANFEQALLHFYESTVLPLKEDECEQLNQFLVPAFGDAKLNLWYDEDAVPALEPKREKQWQRAQRADWLTTNEKRELTGYGKYEPGENPADKLIVNASLVPLEVATDDSAIEPLTDTQDVTGTDQTTTAEADDSQKFVDTDENDTEEKSVSHFDLSSENAKKRFWLAQDRVKRNFEKRMKADCKTFFAKEKKEIVLALKRVDKKLFEFEITRVLESSVPSLKKLLETNLRAVMKYFGGEVLNQGKASPVPETKDSEDRFTFSMERFINSRVEATTKRTQATTQKRLLKALEDAQERDDDGHEIEIDIESTVKDSYDAWSDPRSDTLSRTEVHTAANEASREAAKALQIPNLQKEWVAARDDRTRDSHADVDGEVVGLDEQFKVARKTGFDLMDGPGDKNASPENVINCRCTLVYHTGQDE